MDDNKQQGQKGQQSQQDPKRNPGQPGQGTDQGQEKGQQQRQGQHDMPNPGKRRDDENPDDRGHRASEQNDKT